MNSKVAIGNWAVGSNDPTKFVPEISFLLILGDCDDDVEYMDEGNWF